MPPIRDVVPLSPVRVYSALFFMVFYVCVSVIYRFKRGDWKIVALCWRGLFFDVVFFLCTFVA